MAGARAHNGSSVGAGDAADAAGVMRMLWHALVGHDWCNGHGGGYQCCRCGAFRRLR